MPGRHIFRKKLAVTAHTVLPRAIATVSRITIPGPRYKYILSPANITQQHITTLATAPFQLDTIILYVSMLLLLVLIFWLIVLIIMRVLWYIRDKIRESRRKPSRAKRFDQWRDKWTEGNSQWAHRTKSRAERKIERARSKVGPKKVGKWNKWLDKEAQTAADNLGERTGLLAKQRDGAGESEASVRSVLHLVVRNKDSVGECRSGSRNRNAGIEKANV